MDDATAFGAGQSVMSTFVGEGKLFVIKSQKMQYRRV